MKYYHFTNFEPADISKVITGTIPTAIAAAEKGDYTALKDLYKSFRGMEFLTNPVYKCGGWAFPFDHLLKKFWIKTKHNGIIEGYAPNKTAIYNTMGKHNVIKIMEV